MNWYNPDDHSLMMKQVVLQKEEKMKLRKLAAILLSAIMVVSMASIASADIIGADVDAPNTTKTDETLVVTLASEPSTLWGSGAGQVENEAQIIISATQDTLVNVDKTTGEILPRLATAWEWVDSTHCKFTLRDDVTMTDGSPLVADDVVYSVGVWTEFSANNDTGRYLVGAEAVDEHTVVIEFVQECPDLVSMMCWSNFGIVSQDEVEALGGVEAACKNPVMGSGRYIFKEWVSGQSVTLERNENYWDPDYAGYFKTIVVKFTNDPAAREMAIESGDSQVAADMPVIQATAYQGSPNVNVVIYDFGQVTHLWYNMTEGRATADQKVRQAIEKAINYEALAMVGTGGQGTQALGYLSPASPYYHEIYTPEERALDIEGAKALLAEAGYPDGLTLEILGLQDSVPTYTVIQENLRAIGITLNINTPDTASFVGDAFGGNYDLIVVGEWIPNRNPSAYVFVSEAQIASGFVIGGPKVTTPELEALRQQIIKEPDNATASGYMEELETILKNDTITTNLYPELKAAVVAKDLKGFGTIERGFMDITTLYK